MLELSTSGTLGDSFIIVLKLMKFGNTPIKVWHCTSHPYWYQNIKDIYSLLPNVEVEFVTKEERRTDLPIIEASYKHMDTESFPEFNFEDTYLDKPYLVLQPHSGKPNGGNTKMFNIKWVQDIINLYNTETIVLLGTHDSYKGIENCINLVGETSILNSMKIVSQAEGFIGPEGLLSFVALSHKIISYIFYTEYAAVRERIFDTPWQEYAILRKL